MSKALTILTLALITYSLTKARETTERSIENSKTKDVKAESDQDDMNTVDLISLMSECNETFRIEMSYLEALNSSGSFPDETDRTPKCYVRCVLEKADVATEDGVYDPAKASMVLVGLRTGLSVDEVTVMATSCASSRKESCKCERAYQFIKCLVEMEIERYEKNQ